MSTQIDGSQRKKTMIAAKLFVSQLHTIVAVQNCGENIYEFSNAFEGYYSKVKLSL